MIRSALRPLGARSLSSAASRTVNGISYLQLPASFDTEALFAFNKEHGSTPHNFIPDGPVREHLGKLGSGETIVWGAFAGELADGAEPTAADLAGFITAERGSDYWLQTGSTAGGTNTCFIHEFVVSPDFRGKAIGQNLTKLSVDGELGIFGIDSGVTEMYTTVHVGNVGSRTAFVKGGYEEVITYADAARERSTTVLKYAKPNAEMVGNAKAAGVTRVVGLQSGNAVDGIDVGVFDFEAPVRSAADSRSLQGGLNYRTVANKTFAFSAEQRDYVLALRALGFADGNEYARANYKMGEW